MWMPGHLAVGFLLCLVLVLLHGRRHGTLLLPLAYVGFFAVLPDFLHLGELRTFSHSLVGGLLLLSAGILVLAMVHGWRPLLALTAALAFASHLLADLYIGHIYPWYPWSLEFVQNNQFNTLYDIRVELVLCVAASLPFILLMVFWRDKLGAPPQGTREALAIVLLLAPFLLLAVLQTVYFVALDLVGGATVSASLLLLFFLAAIALSILGLIRATGPLIKEK